MCILPRMNSMEAKEEALLDELKTYGILAIAYSGGVDSTYLADCAHEALGDHALMLLADSPSFPREELREAVEIATERGWNLRIIRTSEHQDEAYLANENDRCFHCKNEMFTKMENILSEFGDILLAHGDIEDDKTEDRPGARAAANHCVIAPLQNVGLYKEEIRQLSERRGLPTAHKPSFTCLSTRIPSGTPIDLETLKKIESAENILRTLGYRQYRARHHGDLCRIEIDPADFGKLLSERTEIVAAIKNAGYRFVSLDLCGYTMGSNN